MTASCDIQKRREIVFHPLPPGQVQLSLALLAQVPGLKVRELAPLSLQIDYCIADHCLEDIAPVPESVSRSIYTCSLLRLNRLYFAAASQASRSARVER